MYRQRLRPKYTIAELNQIYRRPHNHTRWEDHKFRVNVTIGVGRSMCPAGMITDLSCGDAAIAYGIAKQDTQAYRTYLGDYAYAEAYDIQGPIEETIDFAPTSQLFILSETLEHLDEPETVLAAIRKKSTQLLMSTPVQEMGTHNHEHYWGWDQEAVLVMLTEAGWTPTVYTELSMPGYEYTYQIWGCK